MNIWLILNLIMIAVHAADLIAFGFAWHVLGLLFVHAIFAFTELKGE